MTFVCVVAKANAVIRNLILKVRKMVIVKQLQIRVCEREVATIIMLSA